MEATKLTGYSAIDLDEVRQQVGPTLKRVEDEDDRMVLYFDEVCIRWWFDCSEGLCHGWT